MTICKECGNVVSYNSYFQRYICDNCGWECRNNNKHIVVNLFDEDVILDKTIYVSLDNEMELFKMFPEVISKEFCYAGSFKETCNCIKWKRPTIITPITKFVTAQVMGLGYDIIVQSKNKYVRFSTLLNGDTEKSLGKQIRVTHNWEKMLYSGCFDLDIPDWR